MPTKKIINVPANRVSRSQKIALLFVVLVGFIVVGSAITAGVYTLASDNSTSAVSTITNKPSNEAVLGIDHSFVAPSPTE